MYIKKGMTWCHDETELLMQNIGRGMNYLSDWNSGQAPRY